MIFSTSLAMQALRHLYVLATEPRCVQAIDVDSRQSVYVPLTVASHTASHDSSDQVIRTLLLLLCCLHPACP